jgi:hypothetical protein
VAQTSAARNSHKRLDSTENPPAENNSLHQRRTRLASSALTTRMFITPGGVWASAATAKALLRSRPYYRFFAAFTEALSAHRDRLTSSIRTPLRTQRCQRALAPPTAIPAGFPHPTNRLSRTANPKIAKTNAAREVRSDDDGGPTLGHRGSTRRESMLDSPRRTFSRHDRFCGPSRLGVPQPPRKAVLACSAAVLAGRAPHPASTPPHKAR